MNSSISCDALTFLDNEIEEIRRTLYDMAERAAANRRSTGARGCIEVELIDVQWASHLIQHAIAQASNNGNTPSPGEIEQCLRKTPKIVKSADSKKARPTLPKS